MERPKVPPIWGICLLSTLLVAALACTVVVTLSRRDRGRVVTGPGAAFMFLGAWLACYHFMFYDLLLTALPALLLSQ